MFLYISNKIDALFYKLNFKFILLLINLFSNFSISIKFVLILLSLIKFICERMKSGDEFHGNNTPGKGIILLMLYQNYS